MSWLPAGTVYGTLLNLGSEFDALRPAMAALPYRAPPRAPVLYIKPANTFSPDGAAIALPRQVPEVEVGATVGLVMGPHGAVAGCVLMNDLSAPQPGFFRPPVRFNCIDGFLGCGPAVADPPSRIEALRVEVRINGERVQAVPFDTLLRPPERLLADVAEFMTLAEGDVLLLGCAAPRPRARAGDRIEIGAPGLGTMAHTLVAEQAA